ncbi:type I polyketide synthase [Saccharopolyspora shandongensis]|uniref:type I polyketide synthase n=1 Tax=Saccharopolyspora shandongensis TaxID=418495 RepID=UPI0033D5FC8B
MNSPHSTVISGDATALQELFTELESDGVRARLVAVDRASHSAQVEVVEDRLRELLSEVQPRSSETVFCSSVTGETIDTAALDEDYWYRNLREPVEFQTAIETLSKQGYRTFLEASPHPVLTTAVEQTLDAASRDGAVLGSLRRDHGGLAEFAEALARAHVSGVDLDWDAVLGATPARVELPTYAFQRERFWPEPRRTSSGDPAALGLDAAEHPLLSAAVDSAETGDVLLTGRVSLATDPWLADHAVAGVVLLPGTAFVELAIRAAEEVNCNELTELVLENPLVLPEQGAVQLQVHVGAADQNGQHPVTIHSRLAADAEQTWTRHATGTLGTSTTSPTGTDLTTWPPSGAQPISTDDFYAHAATRGYDYGPAFRGLQAAWQHGDELFAEVRLPDDETQRHNDHFHLHPALLDAALHPLGLHSTQLRLPFSWRRVALHAAGVSTLRTQLVSTGPDTVSLAMTDTDGRPVASVAELALRSVTAEQVAALQGAHHDAMFRMQWHPVPAPEASGPSVVLGHDLAVPGAESYDDLAGLVAAIDSGRAVPEVVFVPCLPEPGADPDNTADRVRAATCRTLVLLQSWLADERLADSRLVLVTCGAVAADPNDELPDLVHAASWGLVRSAQSEHSGRFVLLDTDEDDASRAAIAKAAATGEPQLAVRAGTIYAPRLAQAAAPALATGPLADPDGTVLITGGTGMLGSRLARHLVATGSARHLVLVGRQGRKSAGAAELQRELTDLGALTVIIAACDVADRDALAQLLGTISDEHPLTAVVHAAGDLDDGVISSLTPDRIERVFRPKADAALHLHELTKHLPLRQFVLFSSASGTLGAPGQGNYAAANSLLDALAQHRHAAGLPATALAWGYWDQASGMTQHLDEDRLAAQLRRTAMLPIGVEQGLALFDAAVSTGEPSFMTARLNTAVLRAPGFAVPPLLEGLVRSPARRRNSARTGSAGPVELRARLVPLPESERADALLALVRTGIAAVLGLPSPDGIPPEWQLSDLGFDSLTAVQLRNALAAETGLKLPATLVFDHPTLTALADDLCARLFADVAMSDVTKSGSRPPVAEVLANLDRLEAALAECPPQERQGIAVRLEALLAAHLNGSGGSADTDLDSVTDEELFELIDGELGTD